MFVKVQSADTITFYKYVWDINSLIIVMNNTLV